MSTQPPTPSKEAMEQRARERALPLVIEGTDRVQPLSSTELIQAFYSHEFAAVTPLRDEITRLKTSLSDQMDLADQHSQTASDLSDRLARLEGALNKIADTDYCAQHSYAAGTCPSCIAKSALAETTSPVTPPANGATPRMNRLRDALMDAFRRYHDREIYREDFAEFLKLTFNDAAQLERELNEAKSKADECWGAANYRLKYLGYFYRALGLKDENMDSRTSEACAVITALREENGRLKEQLEHEHNWDAAIDRHCKDTQPPWPKQTAPSPEEAFEYFKKQTLEPSDSAIELAKFIPLEVQHVTMNRATAIPLMQWMETMRQELINVKEAHQYEHDDRLVVQAERDTLRTRVEELENENDKLSNENTDYAFKLGEASRGLEWQPVVKTLRATITALSADKRRLDCLEENRGGLEFFVMDDQNGDATRLCWRASRDGALFGIEMVRHDVRSAIDAALAATERDGGKAT